MKKGEAATAGKKFAELAVEFPLMLLMCMSMVYPFTTALEFGVSFLTILLTVAFFLGLWAAVLYNRWTMLGSLALAVVIGAVLFFTLSSRSGAASVAAYRTKLDDFLYWAGMYLRGYRSTNLQYAALLIAVFSAFVCLAVCVFTFKQFDLITVLLAGAACYVALIVIGHIINMPSLFCYIFAATLYIMLSSYKRNVRAMPANRSISLPAHMASALPLAAVVLAVTILLSGVIKIDPSWMKDIRDKLLRKTDTVTNEVIKASSKTQITSDELGGDMYLSDDVVMEVTSPVSNVHLRAQSKSFYTGHSWFRTDTDQTNIGPGSIGDTNQTSAFIQSDPGAREKLFPAENISVKYISFNTGIVYAPLKLTSLKTDDEVHLIGGDMLMLDQVSENLTYSFKYYQPEYSNAALADLLRSAGGDSSSDENDNESFTLRKEYTQLPDELPQRVRDLANKLTQGKTTDYDKAVAVESYLRNNFTYTLTPGSSDLNRDFVDQFLFEGKKGYCTYFATVMAVLLRCENIPARYVEGYVLPANADENNVYKVTRKQGHAWTEVYFKGVGWMTFEPTASFTGDYISSGATAPTPKPTLKPTINPLPTASNQDTAVSKPTDQPIKRHPVNMALPALILALAAASLLLAAVPFRSRLTLQKLAPKDSAVLLFGQYLRLFAALGEFPRSEDGLASFSKWIEKQYSLPNAGFSGALDIFQQARFSTHEITPEQKQAMLAFRRQLLTASKKKLGIFKYLFFRYIWGI
jgi:transglutaminase-like putative cysteine protease